MFLFGLFCILECALGAVPTDEQRLLDKLLTGYNPASRPVYNASEIVTVKFGITLTQVSDMVSALNFIPFMASGLFYLNNLDNSIPYIRESD